MFTTNRPIPVLLLAALAISVSIGCEPPGASDSQLSRPSIEPELWDCATTVTVKGFVPGAQIDIWANVVTHLGGGTSDSPWGQVFAVNPALAAGDSITATQTLDGDTSLHSKPLVVGHYEETYPEGMTKPELREPIYRCGGAISVGNLVRGGLLRVYADGAEVGHVEGCGEGQWLTVSPQFKVGQEITADEQLCSAMSPLSDPAKVVEKPGWLPKVGVGEIYENGKYTTLSNITNGALVTVFGNGTEVNKHHYPGGGQIVRLEPQVQVQDEITALQQLCSTESELSDPSIVKPCSELPPPALGPICDGDDYVTLDQTVLGSHVEVYRDGLLAASGGGPTVNLFAPAQAGENYWATQSLGSCTSGKSTALAVGCQLPEVMKPGIPNGGRAVAVAVDPASDQGILVASETGGLFRSSDRGKNWSHVSKATSFRYTDLAYLPYQPGTVIATARQDSRTLSAGGIWRSTDGGSNWTRVVLDTPEASCFDDISGFALSVDERGERVWAGTSCGLALSDDAGSNWTFIPVTANYHDDPTYAVLIPGDSRIVIVTDNGLKVSNDAAASWTTAMTGIPGSYQRGDHNQIEVAPNDPDHLWWAFLYSSAPGKMNRALYRSTDFGAGWTAAIDVEATWNRPPFVRTAFSLEGDAGAYDVYWGDGECALRRASATTGGGGGISSWTSLAFDHCDPSDLGFENDDATPLLLLSDGGLHATADQGGSWTMVGAGPYGYNALQITEVTGQLHQQGAAVDLYFATQDNDIWASPDGGATWPGRRCCEGFFLNIMRDFYPQDQTRLTGVSCAACGNFISGKVLAGQTGFANCPASSGAPRLLKPGSYVQNSTQPDASRSNFTLSQDNGGSWNLRYQFDEAPRDLSRVSGDLDDRVIFTAFKDSGTVAGQEAVHIKRITGVLGGGTPIVSTLANFGGLGVFPTMFAWYRSFWVDPGDPNFLVIVDISDDQVKVTSDGGMTWNPDALLTDLVTHGGYLKFKWNGFTQVSTVGFDPYCPEHILVGTQEGGIFTTYDRGTSWGMVAGSGNIPYVSSFFFSAPGEVIISSYGRGLWKHSFACAAGDKSAMSTRSLAGQDTPAYVYDAGVKFALGSIHDPAALSDFGYYLVRGGEIVDIQIEPESRIATEVVLSKGEIAGYSWDGETLELPFAVSFGTERGTFSGDEGLVEELSGRVRVRGLLLEGITFRGAIMAARELSPEDLPRPVPLGAYIAIENLVNGQPVVEGLQPIRVRGRGFRPGLPLEVLLDGEPAELREPPEVDETGAFLLEIPQSLGLGGHTVHVIQGVDGETLRDTATFLKTVADDQP